ELLERVVGEHGGADTVGDLEQELVAPADCARGRRHELAGRLPLLEGPALGGVDAVAEGGVDDDDQLGVGTLLLEGADGLVELGQAGLRPTLGGDVRAVDDDVILLWHSNQSTTAYAAGGG